MCIVLNSFFQGNIAKIIFIQDVIRGELITFENLPENSLISPIDSST